MTKPNLKMPAEWELHEGTWLQWPHNQTNKGEGYREKLDNIWVNITKELQRGERVHIVVHNDLEKDHVVSLLRNENLDMNQVDFMVQPTDDIWIRDNGPIFIYDDLNNLVLTKWIFNGWGNRFPYQLDSMIPAKIAESLGITKVDAIVCLEGGGIEVDGKGSFMAAKSSIINDNRNPGMTQREIEVALKETLGVSNFIWITGIRGEDNADEVTDFHIDGAARFAPADTILYEYDPSGSSDEYLLKAQELHYQEVKKARNLDGRPFKLIPVPVTRKNVEAAGCRGSYLNYYVGNEVVLVPIYGDENDQLGLRIVQGQFPDRRVVGINICDLFAYGGMIHCVTQQQPAENAI